MKSFRFSPIKNKDELFEAIKHTHFESYRLLKQNLGYLLPVSGNVGVFCHYDEEFKRLTKMGEEMTDLSDNWNKKYFKLYKPIIIPPKGDAPETIYTYLYIRRPELSHPHVGDVDFYLQPDKYKELKRSLLSGKIMSGVKIFERPDLDLIRLYDPDIDVSAFIGDHQMSDRGKR